MSEFEVGTTVRILTGKGRGRIVRVKAEEEGFVLVDMGGGLLKRYRKESVSPVRWYYSTYAGRNHDAVEGGK